MDLTTYMIITSIYWTIAFYYPIKTTPMRKRIIIRLFWLPVMIFIVLRMILYIVILIAFMVYTRLWRNTRG